MPGESIVPANAETAKAAVRTATAHVRVTLLTILYLPVKYKNFCMKLDEGKSSCKGLETALNLLPVGRFLFLAFSIKSRSEHDITGLTLT